MQKEFEEASFALKPGEISPVIETASGLHLIERYVHALSTPPAPQPLCLCGFCIPRNARRFRWKPLASNASTRPRIVALTRLSLFSGSSNCRCMSCANAVGRIAVDGSLARLELGTDGHNSSERACFGFCGWLCATLGKMDRIKAKGNPQNANVNIEMLSLIVLDARRLLARISEFPLSVLRSCFRYHVLSCGCHSTRFKAWRTPASHITGKCRNFHYSSHPPLAIASIHLEYSTNIQRA